MKFNKKGPFEKIGGHQEIQDLNEISGITVVQDRHAYRTTSHWISTLETLFGIIDATYFSCGFLDLGEASFWIFWILLKFQEVQKCGSGQQNQAFGRSFSRKGVQSASGLLQN